MGAVCAEYEVWLNERKELLYEIIRNKNFSCGEKTTKFEREEQKLLQSAQKHMTAPARKTELEDKIPEKVMSGLEKAFSKSFFLIFEKGAVIIEKTYDKESITKEFQINDHAIDAKGSRKEIGRIRSGAFGSSALNTVVATVEGIGLGALGISLSDIVIWMGVLLRGIYETVLKYGFAYETPEEQMFILKMIEASMMTGEKLKNLSLENNRYINRNTNIIPDENELK